MAGLVALEVKFQILLRWLLISLLVINQEAIAKGKAEGKSKTRTLKEWRGSDTLRAICSQCKSQGQ